MKILDKLPEDAAEGSRWLLLRKFGSVTYATKREIGLCVGDAAENCHVFSDKKSNPIVGYIALEDYPEVTERAVSGIIANAKIELMDVSALDSKQLYVQVCGRGKSRKSEEDSMVKMPYDVIDPRIYNLSDNIESQANVSDPEYFVRPKTPSSTEFLKEREAMILKAQYMAVQVDMAITDIVRLINKIDAVEVKRELDAVLHKLKNIHDYGSRL